MNHNMPMAAWTQIVLNASVRAALLSWALALTAEAAMPVVPEGKEPKAPEKKSAVQRKKRRETLQLVPPPPPIAPSAVEFNLSMPMGIPVELMSEKDLQDRKKDLTERAAGLKDDLEDRERQVKEKKERAVLFESLFKEGVVSRRELENAGKEASLMDKELKVNRDEFKDLNKALTAISERLNKLAADKQSKGAPGKAASPSVKKPMNSGKPQSTASK